MSSLAPPLLLVDQPAPNMFDYANSATAFPHHHPAAMANWSTFQLQTSMDHAHQHPI
jgi:hypothetical protein